MDKGKIQVLDFLVELKELSNSWEPKELLKPCADKLKKLLEASHHRGRRLD